MIVQWCIKGLALPSDADARKIINSGLGLISNWWRGALQQPPFQQPPFDQIKTKLTPAGIDMHVNHFTEIDPATQQAYSAQSPFISLSAGAVERNAAAQTNIVHRARKTALLFGTNFGRLHFAYLFTCWVVLAPRRAVSLEGVAEEVRDLNTYRRYSAFQTEGEVVAKLRVPDNQIKSCEKWQLHPMGPDGRPCLRVKWTQVNPRFIPPERLTNIRQLI
jgi:hypothetical protein